MAKDETSIATKLADLLNAATSTDLADLDQQMRALKTKLDGLRQLRNLIAVRLDPVTKAGAAHHKKPTAAGGGVGSDGSSNPARGGSASSPAARASITDERRRAAVRHLSEHGPLPPMKIATALSIPQGSITALLDHEWFSKSSQGVHITTLARQDVLDE